MQRRGKERQHRLREAWKGRDCTGPPPQSMEWIERARQHGTAVAWHTPDGSGSARQQRSGWNRLGSARSGMARTAMAGQQRLGTHGSGAACTRPAWCAWHRRGIAAVEWRAPVSIGVAGTGRAAADRKAVALHTPDGSGSARQHRSGSARLASAGSRMAGRGSSGAAGTATAGEGPDSIGVAALQWRGAQVRG